MLTVRTLHACMCLRHNVIIYTCTYLLTTLFLSSCLLALLSLSLSLSSLSLRLYDLAHLLFLYPNRLKDDVFGPYYTPPRESL